MHGNAAIDSIGTAIEKLGLDEGLPDIDRALLATLARYFHCQWGTFWKYDGAQKHLHAVTVWHEEGLLSAFLDQETLHRKISVSKGTAGRVWRSRQPVWSTDLTTDLCLPRSLDAAHADLHGGIWFAVKTSDDAVWGVIELLSTKLEGSNEEEVALVEQVGIAIGRCLKLGLESPGSPKTFKVPIS